jgi:hypothetical protein
MALFKPFDYNPATVTAKTNTSNEAVPAGRFAYVVADVGGGEFFINDNVALKNSPSFSTSAALQPSDTTVFTNNTQNVLIMWFYSGSGDFTVRVSGIEVDQSQTRYTLAVTRIQDIVVNPGETVSANFNSGQAGTIACGGYYEGMSSKTAEFWVPTGTNLRVSGDARYTIQEYLIPT